MGSSARLVLRGGYHSSLVRTSSAHHLLQYPFRTFSTPPSPPATKAEIDALKSQIATLQNLVRQSISQSASAANLARSVSAQSVSIEAKLASVERNVTKISALERVVDTARDRIIHNPATQAIFDAINAQPAPVKNFLLSKYAAGGLAGLLAAFWVYRDVWYAKTSKEAAEIAALTLRQESLRETAQETLEALASSPETLATLNALLGKLIQEPRTLEELLKVLELALAAPAVRASVLDLLSYVFQDPNVQKLAGQFILLGLEIPDVKAMLERQTADLVSRTVLDERVQRDTGVGVRSVIGFAFVPEVLRSGVSGFGGVGSQPSAGQRKEVDKMAARIISEMGDATASLEMEGKGIPRDPILQPDPVTAESAREGKESRANLAKAELT